MSHAPIRPERRFALPERYRIRRHIATGGMASVWCAEDLVLGRDVAVKVLAERFAHDGVAVRRFQREARAAARVSGHPHVVTIYDVGEAQDAEPSADATRDGARAFIVMEFLAGGTVADAIRHDSVRRHESLRWLREAALALDHAHGQGIVHRDIKPANFLLDRARVLHVADFGIARLTTEETITSADQLFGTAAYLSPEQALGREATGASDRYALAVAAFELLAGERPFSAPHFSAQARQHIEEPPPAASEIDRSLPPAVDEILYAGLAKDPAARPESARALVTALEDALAGRARPPASPGGRAAAGPVPSTAAAKRSHVPATRPPAGRPVALTGHRRRFVVLGALAAAVLLVAGITLATTRGSGGHHAAAVAARTPTHHTIIHAPDHHAGVGHTTHTKTATTTTMTTAAPTTTAPVTPESLQSAGHQEMLAGDYPSAISTLRQAVAAAPPGSSTYAYALYDLGRSELLSGDPTAAIPILRQRLKIPNQQGTVQNTLDQALAQAGAQTTAHAPRSGGVAPSTTPASTDPGSAQTTSTTSSTTPTAPVQGSGGAGLSGSGAGPNSDTFPGRGHAGRRHAGGHRAARGIIQILTAAVS